MANLISSQRYRDDSIVSVKLAARDFVVRGEKMKKKDYYVDGKGILKRVQA